MKLRYKSLRQKRPEQKKPAARNRLIEEPFLNSPNHVFEMYEECCSDVDLLEDSLKGENEKSSKEDDCSNMDEKKRKASQPTEIKNKTM